MERYNVLETSDPAKQTILDGGLSQRVLTQYVPFDIPTIWDGFVIQNGNPSVEWKPGSLIYSESGDSEIVGVLYQYNEETRKGMMFGLAEIKKQWGGYETDLLSLPVSGTRIEAGNDLAGKENTQSILKELSDKSLDFQESDYVLNTNYASYWCDTLSIGGYSDWYLPAAGEIKEIYKSGILPVLKSLGKDLTGAYWSSSQIGNYLAWSYHFQGGYFHPALKYVGNNVSAVHAFSAPENLDPIYKAGGGAFLKNKGILQNSLVMNNESPSRVFIIIIKQKCMTSPAIVEQ